MSDKNRYKFHVAFVALFAHIAPHFHHFTCQSGRFFFVRRQVGRNTTRNMSADFPAKFRNFSRFSQFFVIFFFAKYPTRPLRPFAVPGTAAGGGAGGAAGAAGRPPAAVPRPCPGRQRPRRRRRPGAGRAAGHPTQPRGAPSGGPIRWPNGGWG